MNYSRLVMMNFLHTNYIPKRIHIHHENEITTDDTITNLTLLLINSHMKHHHPHDYKYGVSKAENRLAYEREWRRDPKHREALLTKRRERYQQYKLDPAWLKKDREQKLKSYYKTKPAKQEEINEIS